MGKVVRFKEIWFESKKLFSGCICKKIRKFFLVIKQNISVGLIKYFMDFTKLFG